MKILIVIDMQNDFVTGSLGTKEAKSIVPNVVSKINTYRQNKDNMIIFTRDTHDNNYLKTLEGIKLPILHCIIDTKEWQIIPEIKVNPDDAIINKKTFGFDKWGCELYNIIKSVEEIEICGLCTDICVISNALFLRTLYPNMPITIDAKCCAGVTPEKHLAALEVMKSCQIDIINE